ncbi:PREDICTED: high affinity copper uptake protein 1 isoform X1 [Rhagoletis zephyria]|uniref:high affinity copper uptake protein 1 isoform X1 n=1 Tax=Rhagoletis zephyria TaxID=28612 RepID=UPI000811582D|nr:PREDICTED: high affinity copper uptake protein 1 isoform X1 [Rhagoletis zephyria]
MDMGHTHGNDTSADVASCPMIMVFHGGHCERILWRNWVASTYVEFALSCLAFVVMGILYETLKFLRQQLNKRAVRKEAEGATLDLQLNHSADNSSGPMKYSSRIALAEIRVTSKTYWRFLVTSTHIITSLLFLIQVALSYVLMLVFMNYNYWLCLSVVLGLGLGYFFFGWSQHDAYDNDCCH